MHEQPDPILVPYPSAVPTVRHLQLEWDGLRRRRSALRRVRRWALPGTEPRDLDEVLARAGYQRPRDDEEGDRYLSRLVGLAAEDELAARVVLQRLLPALVAIARRRANLDPRGIRPVLDELVGTAWIVIRTYPIDRRPDRVAANLVRDCEYQQFVRDRRRRSHQCEIATPPVRLPEQPMDEPGEGIELTLALAARRGLEQHDLELVQALAGGVTVDELAHRWRITDRAVRYRRAQALARLRQLVG